MSYLFYTLRIQKTNGKDIPVHPSLIALLFATCILGFEIPFKMVHWDEFKNHGQEEHGDDAAGHGCHGHGLSFIGL